jgi:Ca2+-binding EF-hand superfamily protein
MTRLQVGLLALILVAVLLPAAYTQFGRGPGGGFGGKGGFGGPGGMGKMFNPDDIFNRMSNGADSFDVNTVELRQRGEETVEQQREKMNAYLQTKGVTNGKMTKELYREFFEGRMRELSRGMAKRGFEGLAKGAASFDVDKVEITGFMLMAGSAEKQREQMKAFLKSKGVTNNQMTEELYAEFNENRMKEFREKGDTRTEEEKKQAQAAMLKSGFESMDLNKDGFLTMDELNSPDRRRGFGDSIREKENFDRFDANKDGKISYEEFQKYIEVRTEEREKRREEREEEKKKEEGGVKADDLDARPPVYRFGKLPKELPVWFNDTDKDQDAQVGLYEWKQQGKDVKEFLAMDANGDGFLTAEEMIRFEKAKVKGVDLQSATAASGRPPAGGPFGLGGPPAGGGPGVGERGGPRNGDRPRRGEGGPGGDRGKGRRGGEGGGMDKGWGGGGFDPEKMKEFREKFGKGKGGKSRGKRGDGDRPE